MFITQFGKDEFPRISFCFQKYTVPLILKLSIGFMTINEFKIKHRWIDAVA